MKRLLIALVFIFVMAACRPFPGQEVVIVERLVTVTPPPTATLLPTTATATAVPTQLPTAEPNSPTPTPKPHIERPQIADSSPPTTLDNRQPDIRLIFSQVMDQASVAAAFDIQPKLPYQLTWESERTLLIRPLMPMSAGTVYLVRVKGTATNSEGIAMGSDQTRSFRPRNVITNYSLPTAHDPHSLIQVHFGYVMDTATVGEQFTLRPPVAGKVEWNEEGTVLSFIPDESLAKETEYRIHFEGTLREANGDALSTVEATSFITPGWVTAVSPTNYESPPTEPIKINFLQPVNKTTTAAAFSISPHIDGAISWEENTLVFTPVNGRFPDYTYYDFSLNITATDLAGRPLLNQPQRWYFGTSHFADVADFGSGYDIQVVAANGRRAVHYRGYNRGEQTVTFNLYQLTPEQFIRQYATGNLDTSSLLLARTWQEQTRAEGDYYLNPQELLIPSEITPGPYILTLSSDFVNDSIFILLSAYNVVAKQSTEQLVAWVADEGNNPAAGASVALYDDNGRLLTSQTTNNSGLATLTPPDSLTGAYLIARTGNDITLTGFEWGWRRQYSYGQQNPYAIHISTDRPIYRPGHTVYYKAIVRELDDVTAEPIAEGTAVTATIRDARGNTVQTFNLTANDYGTVNGQFQLGEGAMLGSYHVVISYDGVLREQEFKVEDYRKPDHAVTVTTDAAAYLTGDTISVTVDSQYFLGEPVANAQVEVTLYYLWGYDSGNSQHVVNGRTDGSGRFTTSFNTVYTRNSGSYIVEAVIDDGSHQGVAGQAPIQIYELAETITLNRGRYLKTPQQPFNVEVTVKDIFGAAVTNRRVTLELSQYDYQAGGYNKVIDSFVGTTDGNGRFTATLTPTDAGYYRLIASSRDHRNHHHSQESWLMAYHRDYWGNWYGRSDGLTLYTNQESYHFDDIAQLFVQSNVSGHALLTIERNNVLSQRVVELTAPLTTIDIPLNSNYVPNVYATIQVWRPLSNTLTANMGSSIPDAELLVSSIKLDVPAIHKQLQVAITPDKAEYAPGETATVTLRTTNFIGDPVSAEVALAVVDEAIFSLSADLTHNMYETFYFQRSNMVAAYDSMRPIRGLWIPGGMGGGGGGGDGGMGIGRPRTNFQDTAAWFPVLRTNANGEVTVSFTLPDDLTSWRLTARAATADTQIGESSFNIITKKEIVVSPILPRILTASDNFILATIVHNYSSQPRTLTVELAGDGLTITGESAQSITIAAASQQIVGWPVAVPEAGELELTLSANDSLGGDAVRLPLTVQPLAIPDMTTQVGQFTGEFNTTLTLPANALPMSTITIDLSRSIAGSLLDGAEYLTGYPYGCVEQTMSRALPNAVVGRALFQLGIGDPARFSQLEPMIQASIQRLYGFQHYDGGWGWWYDDPTHDYQTAWVVFGLAVTADAGYEIDPAVIERGASWLNEHLAQMDIRTRAFALYSMALAGEGNAEETLALAEQLDYLDTFSRAALALALWEVGETAVARQTIDALLETVTVSGSSAYWTGDEGDGYYRQKTMASDTRNTALALSAISQIRPGHALEGSIVRWLMAQRRGEGWGTTNETAFTLLALTDHLLAQPNVATDTEYTVWLNGAVVETGLLGRGRPSTHIVIPADEAQTGVNEIRITQSGGGQLYYVVNGRVYQPQRAIDAAGVIEVTREYLHPQTHMPLTSIEPGEVVEVRLTVTLPEAASYVIVEDKLPGGFEAINEQLDNASAVAESNRNRNYTYKETRGERVSFFITEMSAGKHVFTYFVRATQNGRFVAMPAEAYAMYDLAAWGRSGSMEVVIGE